MKIKTVGPRIWTNQVDHLGPLSRTVIEVLHSHHVGITPDLAEGLVEWIMEDSDGGDFRTWRRVFRRIDIALGAHERGSARRLNALRFRARAAPVYCILRIALPVIQKACALLEESILFSHSRASCTAAAYKKYGDRLAGFVRDVADLNHLSDAFWRERAEVLVRSSNATSLGYVVDCPAPSVLAFERLQPHIPRVTQPLQRIPRLAHQEIVPIVALQGENVDGIVQSTRMEDLPNQIATEWALPDDLWLLRFAEAGVLVRFKPPLRDCSRDLLMVLAIPNSLRQTPLSPFIKSCWYHLCSLLADQLLRNNMLKTEFRLLEGYPLPYYRRSSFELDRLAFLCRSHQMSPDVFRTHFRVALNWLPGLFDQRGGFRRITPGVISATNHDVVAWIADIWKQQQNDTRHSHTGTPFDVTSYERVLVNVVLSTENVDESTRLHRTLEQLFSESIQGRHVTVTLIDPRLKPGEGWSLHTSRGRLVPILADTAGNLDGAGTPTSVLSINWLASRVVEGWWREIRRELCCA